MTLTTDQRRDGGEHEERRRPQTLHTIHGASLASRAANVCLRAQRIRNVNRDKKQLRFV
jgi:hypothetical protein